MNMAKRILALCLSLLLALPLSMVGLVSAEEAAEPAGIQDSPYKILATVQERGTANRHASGFQDSRNGMKIDLTAIDDTVTADDLALFINVYIENRTNPGVNTIMDDSQGQFQLLSEVKDGVYYEVCWNWNKDGSKYGLKEGWNTLLLNFSTAAAEEGFAASKCNINLAKIENYRWGFWNFGDNFAEYDNYRIRVADAAIVDKRYEPEKEPVYENTDFLVGTWSSLKEDNIYSATNNHPTSTPILGSGNHTPDGGIIDLTGHNPDMLYLEMDLFIENETQPDKVGSFFTSSQIRLSSQGGTGYAYFHSRNDYPNVIPGEWNTLRLPMSKISNAANLDTTKINNFYMYYDSVNHAEDSGDTFIMKIRNARIIDITTEPKKMELPTLFGDGMIFQQNKPIKVWGATEAGNTVTVTMQKDGEGTTPVEKTATIDAEGYWEVEFPALAGGYDTYTITATDANAAGEVQSTQTIEDVVIGEVWVAGGQSNMHLSVGDDCQKSEILATATNHNIRIYLEPTSPVGTGVDQPLDPLFSVTNARWGFGDVPSDVVSTSSVGYNFISKLQAELDMPVGLLNTAYGGSVIEAWISRETVDGDKTYKDFLDDQGKYCDAFWWPTNDNRQSTLYNAKIGPLEGYAAKGIIWYQGESNRNEINMYDHALELLQKDWGRVFGYAEDEAMPLVYTHIAPYYYGDKTTYSTPASVLAYTAEAFDRAWQNNKDSMAQIAIYDLPLHHLKEGGLQSAGAIHPTTKIPVAARMFTVANNLVYGGEGDTSSPVYKNMQIEKDVIYINFDLVGDGLKIGNKSQNLQGFAIAGEDGVFVPANAEIVDKDTVKVWNDKVVDPKNVTYAFTSFNTEANLHSSEGLAAIPFRTTKDTEDAKLFKDYGWMYADGEVWVSVNVSDNTKQAAFHDLWDATDATHAYDKEVKSEGIASLKVDYTAATTVTADPSPYQSHVELQFANFGGFTVDFKNPDARAKTVQAKLLLASGSVNLGEAFTLAANSDFTAYDVSFAGVSADNLANAKGLAFEVSDAEAGTVYLDNIRFAVDMDAKAELPDVLPPDGRVMGDLDATFEVTAADALLALQAVTNKITLDDSVAALANVDGNDGVTANDALLILQYATKKIDSFPWYVPGTM